eukprot:Clim_evm42s147 gene=Clim_evmTU42s147
MSVADTAHAGYKILSPLTYAEGVQAFSKNAQGFADSNQVQAAMQRLVVPGQIITEGDEGVVRGHGTYIGTAESFKTTHEDMMIDADGVKLEAEEGHGEGEALRSSVAGTVERVNRLVYVKGIRSRYVGEVGDVVVGRIMAVTNRRWKVDVASRVDGILALSSVNLPGGAIRRRSQEDELAMRQYLQEGDLISAEVQSVQASDGTLVLHARSTKYGRLGGNGGGCIVVVPSILVLRRKNHFHDLGNGVHVILGLNGYIYVGPPTTKGTEGTRHLGDATREEDRKAAPVGRDLRKAIARTRNCIRLLSHFGCPITDTTINYAYEASLNHETISNVMDPATGSEIAQIAMARTRQDGMDTS